MNRIIVIISSSSSTSSSNGTSGSTVIVINNDNNTADDINYNVDDNMLAERQHNNTSDCVENMSSPVW